MVDDQDVLDNLKRDLQDGDDLATAVSLVSDAVQRRIRRVQRSLDLLDPDDRGAQAVRRRLSSVLDRYQQALDTQSASLRLIVDEYQPALNDLADRFESEADASGTDGD